MTKQIPYLLSLCSRTPDLDKHIESVDSNLIGERITTIFMDYPGHVEKYRHIPRNLDPNRYIVFMDTDDVRVQCALPEFTHDLYLAPENAKHRDTIWKKVIEETKGFEELMDEDIYNVGTWAMKVSTLYTFLDFMEWSGLMDSTPLADQLLFNLFIRRNPTMSKVLDLSVFCPLFSNYFHGAVKKDGRWMIKGKLISVVHANGSPKMKEELW